MPRRVLFTLILLTGLLPAAGQAQSLPLGSYCRPGRFLPVPAALRCDTLRLPGGGGIDAAWVQDIPPQTAAAWQAVPRSVPWVGAAGSVNLPEADLRKNPLVTRLALASLRGSPAAAWNALDELVLTSDDAAILGEAWLATLAAAGTQIELVGAEAEWRTECPPVSIPPAAAAAVVPLLGPEAYLPLDSYPAAGPAPQRQRLLILAGLLSLAVVLIPLMLPCDGWKWAAVGLLATSILLLFWGAQRSPIKVMRGTIFIEGAQSVQDQWLYFTARRDADFRLALRGRGPCSPCPADALPVEGDLLLPMLESPRQLQQISFESDHLCRIHLRRGERLALWARRLGATAPGAIERPQASPLRAVAEAIYFTQGDCYLKGQARLPGSPWPALVLAPKP